MTIQNKLISAFLGIVSVLLLTMVLALQWSFDQGLLEYVSQQRLQQQDRLMQQLQQHYARYGSWKNVRWRSIMDRVMERQGRPDRRGSPPRLSGRYPPRDNFSGHRPPHERREAGHRPPPPPDGSFKPSLLDADKTPLIGRYNKDFVTSEIVVNNQVVGWIALPPAKELSNAADLAFRKHQKTALLVIAGVMIMVALLVAIPLARHWSKPLRRIAKATHRLSNGDYSQRLETQGSDELSQLASDVNQLAQTLENNESARKHWVASVSHELRTPVAILRGEIEAIIDGIRPLDMNSLKSLQQETDQLTRLIQDLYELTNADLGAMRYRKEHFDLTTLLDDTLELYQTALREAGISLHWSGDESSRIPTPVFADGNRIQQVLENILSNSMKYADASDLFISLLADDRWLQLTIEDSGSGVPEETLEKLFDHLYRVEVSRNRGSGGSGLGLAICKKIIEAHDGEIHAFSSRYGGLGIAIRLPLDVH